MLVIIFLFHFSTTPGLTGTCYTASECANNGGRGAGNCAAGFACNNALAKSNIIILYVDLAFAAFLVLPMVM